MRPRRPVPACNRRVAERLLEASRLLEGHGASRYRVNAFRAAARGVLAHPRSLLALFQEDGVHALDAIPGVGLGIAAAIAEMLVAGRWRLLEELRRSVDPASVFQSLPGLGPALARRIRDDLRIATLEQLHEAAHDGRLEALPGVGLRRACAWRAVLGDMLGTANAPSP